MYLHSSFQLWRRLVRHDALGVHFDLGLRAFDERDKARLAQNLVAVAMLPEGGTQSLEHLALSWRMAWIEQRREDALAIARTIVARFPEDADGHLELAQLLVDMERPSDAGDVLALAVKQHPDDPDLWFELGLAAERAGVEEIAHEAFYEVWRIEHDDEPRDRLFLSEDAFAQAVERTLDELPPSAQKALGNVAVIVEDYPDEWVVADDVADPRVLGLFIGPTRHTEGSVEAVDEGPSRIYIYRWNVERQCATAEDVEAQIRITVLHEVGHYLGLDEDDLAQRGLS